MTDIDRNLRHQLRKESDDMLFNQMELNDQLKQRIRQQAVAEKARRRFTFPKAWVMGTVAMVAAIMIIAGFPMLQQPTDPAPAENLVESLPPSSGDIVGSELSQLITTSLNSVEDAKAAFGPSLLVPNVAPEGFTLSEIVSVGMEGEPVRDVIFTYVSGEKTTTFTANRNPASFPVDMFRQTQVRGIDGFVFEQPEFTELFWMESGIQYSVIGQLSVDQAMEVAESIEP